MVFLQALLRDVNYALRVFWKKPGFTLVLIISLALGIGANTAIFSMVDAVLFRQLPVQDPGRLVRIYSKPDFADGGLSNSSYPVYEDYRDQSDVFSGIATYSDSVAVDVSRSSEKPQRVYAMLASGNYFSLLGARAAQGRLFSPQDDRPDSNSVVVLSYRAWHRVFGGSNSIVGAQITLNRHPFTIIGVAQPEFLGLNLEDIPEMWLPVSTVAAAMPDFADLNPLQERGFSWLSMIGKLKPGVALVQAQAQLDTIAKRREARQKNERHTDPYPQLVPAQTAAIDPGNRAETSRLSWILLAIVALVLMVSCAVCAGLLLVRAESRQKEIAVRRAIGASSSQIVRQLLVESVLLSLLGAAAGILLAGWVMDVLLASIPPGFPIPLDASAGILNLRVLLFSIALSVVSGVVFGLAPAIRSARTDLIGPLKNQATLLFERFRAFNLRTVFVMVQLMLSVMLLIAAGLLIRTLHNATAQNPGFDPDGGLLASIDISRQGYTEETGRPAFEKLLEQVRNLPGVRSAALAKSVPVQNSGMRVTMDVPGPHPQNDVQLDLNIVSAGYFSTLGVPVLTGRDFSSSDQKKSPRVVIYNQAMAKK
jgi:predicted permease